MTANLAASGSDSAEGILMKEVQKMCFVGRKNVNYVFSGTNFSGDLIVVAFLIWDSIVWALETQQSLPASRAAHAEL